MAETDLKNLKEAIIDLYLAIKIRSTEELDQIDEGHLEKEKKKLLKQDSFQVLEYIRSSIEIIMNLKIEDLEKEMTNKRGGSAEAGLNDMNSSGYSITSSSFVHASMKEALATSTQHGNNIESQKGQRMGDSSLKKGQQQASDETLPKEYEKMLQKLEADIRGHIRLEHEMKIHLDYLEQRVEDLENQQVKDEAEKKKLEKKCATHEEKLKFLKEETENQIRKGTEEKIALQNKLEQQLKANKENMLKYEQEIEKLKINQQQFINQSTITMLPIVNMNQSIDYSNLPSNQMSAQSNSHQSTGGQINPISDKNIYQTISDTAFTKNQLQAVTRNQKNSFDPNQITQKKFVVTSGGGAQSSKKRRQSSNSKDRMSYQGGSINSFLDFSNRQSKQNIIQNVNPYVFEVSSAKKKIKKKPESIDYSKQKKQKILRNSQNFSNPSQMLVMHNRSMIEDQNKQWLMTSADSDNLNMNVPVSQSFFIDYPHNQTSVNQTLSHDRVSQQQYVSSVKKQHSFENSGQVSQNQRYSSNTSNTSGLPNTNPVFQKNMSANSQFKLKQEMINNFTGSNFHDSTAQQTIQVINQNNNHMKNQSTIISNQSIRNSIEVGQSQVALKSKGNNRPNSHLGKSSQFHNGTSGPGNKIASNIKIKEKSASKLRVRDDIADVNSTLNQLIQAQIQQRDRSHQQQKFMQQQQFHQHTAALANSHQHHQSYNSNKLVY